MTDCGAETFGLLREVLTTFCFDLALARALSEEDNYPGRL